MKQSSERWIVRYRERGSGDEVSETVASEAEARARAEVLRTSPDVVPSTIETYHHLDAIGRGLGPLRALEDDRRG